MHPSYRRNPRVHSLSVHIFQVGPKQQLASSVHLGGALGSGGAGAGPLRDRKMAEDVVVTIHVKTPLMTNSLHPSHGEPAARVDTENDDFVCERFSCKLNYYCRHDTSVVKRTTAALVYRYAGYNTAFGVFSWNFIESNEAAFLPIVDLIFNQSAVVIFPSHRHASQRRIAHPQWHHAVCRGVAHIGANSAGALGSAPVPPSFQLQHGQPYR